MKTSITQCLMFIDAFSNGFKDYKEIGSNGMVICLPDANDSDFEPSFDNYYKLVGTVEYLKQNSKSFSYINLDRNKKHEDIRTRHLAESASLSLNILFRRYYLSIIYYGKDINFIALGSKDRFDHDSEVILSHDDKQKKLESWKSYRPKINLLDNLDLIEQNLKKYFEINFIVHKRCLECFQLKYVSSDNIYSAIDKIINKAPRDTVKNTLPLITGYNLEIDKHLIVYEITITSNIPKPTRIFYSKKNGIHLWGIGHFDK